MMATTSMDDIDFMSDSLSMFGDVNGVAHDDGLVRYGPLVLNIPPKEGKAISLLADQLFSPSLLLSERIERELISLAGKTVLELGAGCALPSVVAATLPTGRAPSLVVATDYPDVALLANLRINVAANARLYTPGCRVVCEGYEWGADIRPLFASLTSQGLLPSPSARFDVLILSDLLHFHNSHGAILTSLRALLARTPDARAYVAAGAYTPPHVCAAFVRLAQDGGAGAEGEGEILVMEEGAADDEWRGSRAVTSHGESLGVDSLGIRKGMCRWWTVRWSEKALQLGKGK